MNKTNWLDHVSDNIEVNKKAYILANKIIELLKEKGYKAKQPPPPGNYVSFRQRKGVLEENMLEESQYRQEIPNWRLILSPHLSHRYIAVRSGVASFGWSGNVGIKDVGTTIILGSVVTSSELEPTDPIPQEDSFCDNCKICVSACPSEWLERDKECSITLGGIKFTHCARKSMLRCQIICGGFSGLHKSGKWSTWSPGRFHIPDDDRLLFKVLFKAYTKYQRWPENNSPKYKSPYKLRLTCGFCQLVCFGNKKETVKNYKMLINSGCVIQAVNGDYIILPGDKAREFFEKLPIKHRKLYQ